MFAAESHTSRHHIAIAAMACLCFLLGGPSYAAGEHDWAELEKAARKMIESSLELADSVEAA